MVFAVCGTCLAAGSRSQGGPSGAPAPAFRQRQWEDSIEPTWSGSELIVQLCSPARGWEPFPLPGPPTGCSGSSVSICPRAALRERVPPSHGDGARSAASLGTVTLLPVAQLWDEGKCLPMKNKN